MTQATVEHKPAEAAARKPWTPPQLRQADLADTEGGKPFSNFEQPPTTFIGPS